MAVIQTEEAGSAQKGSLILSLADLIHSGRHLIVLLSLALIAIVATAQSALKLFWWDELASYDIAQLPHASDVWSFFRAGLDTPSPVPTLIVQWTLQHVGGTEVLARLPFEIGFLLMCFCLYGIVARRYSTGYALAALMLPALSGTFYFSTELRTYGITLACIAFALYCWQDSDKPGLRRPLGLIGIFVGLSFAILCHVFCTFSCIPFGIAQIVRDWRRKKIDFAAWAAMLLAPLPLLIEMPGFNAAHKLYAGTFWAKPNLSAATWSWSYCLGTGWMLVTMIVLMVYPALQRKYAQFKTESAGRGFDAGEWTIITVLALQPVYAWPLSHLVGVYVSRYVITLTVGVALLIIAGTAEALKRNRIAGVVLFALFVLAFVQDKHRMVSSALHKKEPLSASLQKQPWIQALEKSSLPIIAPNTPVYTQMQHYISPEMQSRFYYTYDTPAAVKLDEESGAELSMQLFEPRLPFLHVEKFSDFAAQHKSFLVVVEHPIEPGTNPGNLSVKLIGSYHADEQFGISYFSVYQVDVLDTPQKTATNPGL